MTSVAIRFPAGHYHATPWGRHVNEAAVAWPPEPIRILRALIATWHLKADRDRWSEETLASLIDRLAAEPPHYDLPPASHSHSRSFMPLIEGIVEKRGLIFDGFLRLDNSLPLIVSWPGVALDDEERTLLAHLLKRLGYLGRAESWCSAELLDTDRPLPSMNCVPAKSASSMSGEPVDVLAVMSVNEYESWRREAIAGLDSTSLKGKRRAQVERSLPERLVDLLRIDSGDFQRAGWSHPPGTKRVTYLRDPAWASGSSVRTIPKRASPHAVRFALSGRPLPRVEEALRIGELTRVSLMGRARRVLGETAIPSWLSGRSGDKPVDGHSHAFFLPEDADDDGWIDHVLVIAGSEMESIREITRSFRRMWTRKGEQWKVLLEWESDGPSTLLFPARSRTWRSMTPYLHPWFQKKNFGYEEQMRRECAERGFPSLTAIRRLDSISIHGTERRPLHFHRFRSRGALRQPDRQGAMFEIEFDEPIAGPVALGFACHYGLGLFRPAAG